MIHFRTFSALAILSGVLAAGLVSADDPAPAPTPTEPATEAPALKTDKQAIETFGWFVAQQSAVMMEFTDEELEIFLAGFKKGVADPGAPETKEAELQAMGAYLQARLDEIEKAQAAIAAAKSAEFFAALEKNEKVKKSATGLYYEIIEPGDAVRATEADSVTVHYTGTLLDGTVFDSSVERGEPATFRVNGVVPGFSEGVRLVGNGGKVKLYIPSNLGYGAQVRPGGPIPPNATLIFDVEMIAIKK